MLMNRDILTMFDEHTLPTLDVAVKGALELFIESTLPSISLARFPHPFSSPLIIGSGNALPTGRILFRDTTALFADETTYKDVLGKGHIESAIVISAFGGKSAVGIVEDLTKKNVPTLLLTNNSDSLAGKLLEKEMVLVFPKNREPYTYNVSTYMGMMLSTTKENPENILRHIEEVVEPALPKTLGSNDAFFFLLLPEHIYLAPMILTKCDELFGARVSARVFTLEGAKHAKTVIPYDRELFVSIGVENFLFGSEDKRLAIPLSPNAGYAESMAVAYRVIGEIQKQHPPYFIDNIVDYTKRASVMFGQTITSVVE